MRCLKVTLEEKLNALRENPYFEGLEEAVLHTVAEVMQLRQFERGETLFLEGDPCAGLHIIHTGCVKLYRLSPQGRQYIVNVLQEGATFDEVAVFDRGTNPVNVEALEESTVWVIEAQMLRNLVAAHPAYAQKIIDNLAGNLRHFVERVSEMAFFHVTHRLARLISQLPETALSGAGGTRLTQEQIAARLGTVREVVARSLRELERSGAIHVQNRRISIVDDEALSEWTHGPWN
ncbi:MAG: Crp/Fnr family transcriptional regulator [Chloroflexi bacterium]|nr:Crp/Fnr family transcriptional regulator [Chloroflexota bacterium]